MSVELPTAGRRRGRNRRPADRPWITLESQFMASTKWVPVHRLSQPCYGRSGSKPATSWLLSRELDLIISTNAFVDNPAFEHVLLYKENFVAISSRNFIHEGSPATLQMLADTQPFIRFSRTSTLGIRVERILRYNELDLPRKLEVDHADTLTLLVAQGLGWAITTPTCLLQTGTRFVDVVHLIPIEKGNSSRSIFLVGRRGEFPILSKTIAGAVKQSLLALLDSHVKLRQYVPAGGIDIGE